MQILKKMKRSHLYLIGAIVVLLLLYFIVPDPKKIAEGNATTIEGVAKDDVTYMSITSQGASLMFYKKAGVWGLGEKFYSLDEGRLTNLLDIATAPWKLEVVSTAASYKRYGLDESARTELILKDSADNVLRDVYLGELGNGYRSHYIQKAGDDRIFQTFKILGTTFSMKSKDIRNKNIVKIKLDDLSIIKLSYGSRNAPKGKISFTKTETKANDGVEGETNESDEVATSSEPYTWKGSDGQTYRFEQMNDIVNTLRDLRAIDFAEDLEFTDVEKTMLVSYELIVKGSDGDDGESSEGNVGSGNIMVRVLARDESKGYLTSAEGSLFYISYNDGERLFAGPLKPRGK